MEANNTCITPFFLTVNDSRKSDGGVPEVEAFGLCLLQILRNTMATHLKPLRS